MICARTAARFFKAGLGARRRARGTPFDAVFLCKQISRRIVKEKRPRLSVPACSKENSAIHIVSIIGIISRLQPMVLMA
jgi:hypothetical protein